MRVRCPFLRKKFVLYLDGRLQRREAESLERHLAACPPCQGLLKRVRAGREAGQEFGRLGPATAARPPEFERVWAAFRAPAGGGGRPARAAGPMIRTLSSPLAVRVLLGLVAVQAILLIASNWRAIVRPGDAWPPAVPGFRDFAPLTIREFSTNSRPRIVTEGIVQDVYFDEQERTLHIKLVEIAQEKEPFVICEIRDFRGMTIPREGNRVRVYGLARFDGQPGRGWHEVNPVMGIAVMNR